jgi:predicted transcriptional regulator
MAARNFHLPLSDDLYTRLRAEARRTGRPATSLAREALERWLVQRKKAAVAEGIAAYVAEHAGGPMDLDDDLERAGVDHLRRQKP